MPRLEPVLRSVIGGVSFTIRSDSPTLLAGLCQRWRALPRGPRRPELLFDACFRPRRPRLSLNGRSRLVARDANHLLAELELAIYAEVCKRTSTTPIHASAVTSGEEGILIAGPSGAGKSTLAWRLIQRGADYLAEEHVFLHPDGSLSGLPRALSFANTAGRDLGLTWPERVRLGAGRIGLVVLLELPRAPGKHRPLGAAEAAAGLTQHLHRAPRSEDLARLVRAVSGVPALALAEDGLDAAMVTLSAHLPPTFVQS
jgi:hypothetical protein